MAYDGFVGELHQKTNAQILLCSTVWIDGNLFPKSPEQYEQFNDAIHSIAQKYGDDYIDDRVPEVGVIEVC